MRGTATMMFGHIETLEDRVEHLRRVRDLQDETGVFTAFIDWTYQKSPDLPLQCPTAGSHEYLKTTAVARLFLDNIANIQSSWVTQGGKVGQMSLLFGCNDMGSTMIEENVVSAAGTTFTMNAGEIERLGARHRLRTAPAQLLLRRNRPAKAPGAGRRRRVTRSNQPRAAPTAP